MTMSLHVWGILGPLDGNGNTITYLLDANFANMADDAAPVTSPLTVDVGTLTFIQNDGGFAISSGKLTFTPQSTPTYGDLRAYSGDGLARVSGLTYLTLYKANNSGDQYFSGFKDSLSGNGSSRIEASFVTVDSNIQMALNASYINLTLLTTTLNQVYILKTIMRNCGAFLIIDDTLAWVSDVAQNLTMYPLVAEINDLAATTWDLVRVASLASNTTYPVPALGTRDLDLSTPGTGTGTSSIASPSAGNTFVHTGDTVITFDLTTLPSSGSTNIRFRQLNNDNAWYIAINSAGGILLYERVGGSNNLRANTASGFANNGDKITVKTKDESILVYTASSLGINYASATNYKTQTAGNINNIAAGSAIANLTAKTLDGVANASSSNHPGYGLATDVLPGPRAAGDTFTHEADCVLEFENTALPSSGGTKVRFRVQDETNYWYVNCQSGTNLALFEVVNNSPTQHGIDLGVLSGGERIVVVADDETIKGYYDTTLAWTYASAANFKTETTGEISDLGTGGEVSNLIAWPRDLSSAPNTPETNKIKTAFDLMATP